MEKSIFEDLATPWLASDQHPHYTTHARLRGLNLPLMDELFRLALELCCEGGPVKFGRVALE